MSSQEKLIAAGSQLAFVISDVLEALHDGEISPVGNLGSHDTVVVLADGVKLVLEALGRPEDFEELYAAACRAQGEAPAPKEDAA